MDDHAFARRPLVINWAPILEAYADHAFESLTEAFDQVDADSDSPPAYAGPLAVEPLVILWSAVQHLDAIALLLARRRFPRELSVLVLLRSVLEAGARAWWLLDARLDPSARLARALVDHAYGTQEQVKTLSAGGREVDVETALAPIIALAEEAGLSLGWTPTPLGKRLTHVGGQARPKITRLLNSVFEEATPRFGQLIYSVPSGVAHAVPVHLDLGATIEEWNRPADEVHVEQQIMLALGVLSRAMIDLTVVYRTERRPWMEWESLMDEERVPAAPEPDQAV
ncbi:MAG: hypothetical protein M3279_06770 [Actinomycetota bacterium]|nr:hypothetical protein [Actinomycetota bacterium]